MAYGINGALQMGQEPYGQVDSSFNRQRNYVGSYQNQWSVNSPIIVSVHWNGLYENQEPSPANYSSPNGDIVNVIFDVYQISETSGATWPDDWTLVGSIRKSRDIRNISQTDRVDGGDGVSNSLGHIFTVDISEICKDLLSYSLTPHGKGTTTSTFFGGLNGGAEQQGNRFQSVWQDQFIVTKNGSYRKIKVNIRCEIIDGDGIIREATEAGSILNISTIAIINNAPDYDIADVAGYRNNAAVFTHLGWGTSSRYVRSFMTNAKNGYWGGGGFNTRGNSKLVRMDEAAEFLQWVQGTINNYSIYNAGFDSAAGETKYNANNTSDLTKDAWMEVSARDANGNQIRKARLFDWTQNLKGKETINGINGIWPRSHYRMCSQNVSPVYINANCVLDTSAVQETWEMSGTTYTRDMIDNLGNPSDKTSLFLNDDVHFYAVYLMIKSTTQGNGTGVEKRLSELRYFKIDRSGKQLNTPLANSGDAYAGIYYTELRSDQSTLPNPIRCKGFRSTSMGITNQDNYFRIYWLNKCGGIDSYTIKGQKSITYNSQKDVIQRKEPNRFDTRYARSATKNPYPGNNLTTTGAFQSDYMGHSMNHKGGLEVLNVNATKSGKVTTLPLSLVKANWLREILTSPNVWTDYLTVVMDNTGLFGRINYRSVSDLEDGSNAGGRTPNNMEYAPIIITNSNTDIYDESKGLVTMTFEYTHSHAVVTQRN
tara:strand:- start:5302 stop:7431 length:2130 start_codon:yes stop_codon:yes gene_type:complete